MDESLLKSMAKSARDSFQTGDDETCIRLCDSILLLKEIVGEEVISKSPPPLFMLYIFKGLSLQRLSLLSGSPIVDIHRIKDIKECFERGKKIYPSSPLSFKGLISLYENCSSPPINEYIYALDELLKREFDVKLLEKLVPLLEKSPSSQRLLDILLKICKVEGDKVNDNPINDNNAKYFHLLRDILIRNEDDLIESIIKKERYRISAPPLAKLTLSTELEVIRKNNLLTNILRAIFDHGGGYGGGYDDLLKRIYKIIPLTTGDEKVDLLKELELLLSRAPPSSTPFSRQIALNLRDDDIDGDGFFNNYINGNTSNVNILKQMTLSSIIAMRMQLSNFEVDFLKTFSRRHLFINYIEGRYWMSLRRFDKAIPLLKESLPERDSMICLFWSLLEGCVDAIYRDDGDERDGIFRFLSSPYHWTNHHLIYKNFLTNTLKDLSTDTFTSIELSHYYKKSFLLDGDYRHLLHALKEEINDPQSLILLSQHYKDIKGYSGELKCLLKGFEVLNSNCSIIDESYHKDDICNTWLNEIFPIQQENNSKQSTLMIQIDICQHLSEIILLKDSCFSDAVAQREIPLNTGLLIFNFLKEIYENSPTFPNLALKVKIEFYLNLGRLGLFLLEEECNTTINPMFILSLLKRCPSSLEVDILVTKTFEIAKMFNASLKGLERIIKKYPHSQDAKIYYISLRIRNAIFDGIDDLNSMLNMINNQFCEGENALERQIIYDLKFQIEIIKAIISIINNGTHNCIRVFSMEPKNKHQHSMLISYYTLVFLLYYDNGNNGNGNDPLYVIEQFLVAHDDCEISNYLLLKYFKNQDIAILNRIIISSPSISLTNALSLHLRNSDKDIIESENILMMMIENRTSFTVVESLALNALLLLFCKSYQTIKEDKILHLLSTKLCTKFPFLSSDNIIYKGIMSTGIRVEERENLKKYLSSIEDPKIFIKNISISQIQGLYGFILRCGVDGGVVDENLSSLKHSLEERLTPLPNISNICLSLLDYLDSDHPTDFLLEPQTWIDFLKIFNSCHDDLVVVPDTLDDTESLDDVVDTNNKESNKEILTNWLRIHMKSAIFGRFGINDAATKCLIRENFIDCIPQNMQHYLLNHK